MQIFDVANLKPGRLFPEPLFHATGRKLLAARSILSDLHLQALTRSGVKQLFMAPSARSVLEFANTPASIIAVESLAVGAYIENDLMTPDGVVIIQANDQVEEHHLASLRDSGIEFLLARPAADVEIIRAALQDLSHVLVAQIDNLIKRGEFMRAPESRTPFIATLEIPPGVERLNPSGTQLLRRRLTSRLQPVFGLLETGRQPSFDALNEIVEELLALMRTEPRQFSQVALMTVLREDYLPDHAISVAVLSMGIAAHMKLSLEMVKEVMLGALLADAGMLALPKRIRGSSSSLSDADKQRVRQHPVLSLSMFEQIPALTPIPRLIGYQHHERLNGQGYPFATDAGAISDFSRIVAVADILAASTNPRCYKSARLPYSATEELIHMARQNLVDARVVKAMLSAIGLFPVGSFILLSNTVPAQVVGANPTRIDRPLIRSINADGGPHVIDLADPRYHHIKVVKAIAAPNGDAPVAIAS